MKYKLPVPKEEAVIVKRYEEVFYHDGKIPLDPNLYSSIRAMYRSRLNIRYKNKSTIYNNHNYKHITIYEYEELKPKYKNYNVALKKRHIVDEYDIDVIEDRLNSLNI